MEKNLNKFSTSPREEEFSLLKWYIVWDPNKKLNQIIHSSKDIKCLFWTPVQNVYHKTSNNILLKPELLFACYYFVGVPDSDNMHKLDDVLQEYNSKILGAKTKNLSMPELRRIQTIVAQFGVRPQLKYNLRKGDSVTISSGPFTGFNGKVCDINKDSITVLIFFLGNYVNATISILDTTITDIEKTFNEND